MPYTHNIAETSPNLLSVHRQTHEKTIYRYCSENLEADDEIITKIKLAIQYQNIHTLKLFHTMSRFDKLLYAIQRNTLPCSSTPCCTAMTYDVLVDTVM
jgi:hypothetical protein